MSRPLEPDRGEGPGRVAVVGLEDPRPPRQAAGRAALDAHGVEVRPDGLPREGPVDLDPGIDDVSGPQGRAGGGAGAFRQPALGARGQVPAHQRRLHARVPGVGHRAGVEPQGAPGRVAGRRDRLVPGQPLPGQPVDLGAVLLLQVGEHPAVQPLVGLPGRPRRGPVDGVGDAARVAPHEVSQGPRTVALLDELQEAGAVDVARRVARPRGEVPAEAVQRGNGALGHVAPVDHPVQRRALAAAAREVGLQVRGEPLVEPRGQEDVRRCGEEPEQGADRGGRDPDPPEDLPHHGRVAAHRVQAQDVRVLVHEDGLSQPS